MFQLFHALAARLKALFVANVALDFESELAARHAERKAGLLRRASDFERENLPEVAAELRQRAAELDLRQPLASVLLSIEHWQAHPDTERPALPNHREKKLLTHTDKTTTKKRRCRKSLPSGLGFIAHTSPTSNAASATWRSSTSSDWGRHSR